MFFLFLKNSRTFSEYILYEERTLLVMESETQMRQKGLDEEEEFFRTMGDIRKVADTGLSILGSMGSRKKMPFSFNDLHFIPAATCVCNIR